MTADPLVAAPSGEPTSAWAGIGIAEDIELIAQGVRGGNWVDGTLGIAGAGLDGLALVSDPVGALLQYGIAWLIEHVRPLSEALDWLAGDPARITAHAQTWRNAATALRSESDDLSRATRSDLPEWRGAAAAAYRNHATQRNQSLPALAKAADTMALMTEGAGVLIGTVRLMVRDAVATVVSRLIVYAGELIATAGLATPLVVEQVTTLVASWAAKIARWLRDLIASLRRLTNEGGKLGQLIGTLKRWLTRDGRSSSGDSPTGPSPGGKGPDDEARTGPAAPEPPNFDSADIPASKVAGYAMNPEHPVGRHKFRVIHSATGLGPHDAALVEQQIRDGVRAGTPVLGKADEYGQRWSVDVPLSGPSGSLMVRTAWITDAGSTTPRLTTISLP